MADQQVAVSAGQCAQLVVPVLVRLRVGQRQFTEGGVQGEFEEIVLGVDVPVDGHRGHVQLGGQPPHGELGQPLGVQQPDGGLGDAVPVQPGGLSAAARPPRRSLPSSQTLVRADCLAALPWRTFLDRL